MTSSTVSGLPIHSHRAVVRRVLQGGWRRRALILVPFLLMIPLSIAAALLMPRSYAASGLVLISDQTDNPLVRTPSMQYGARVQERIGAFRAVLMSERFLGGLATELAPSGSGPETRRMLTERLKQSLDVDIVGLNLLRFYLRSSEPAGTGAQLQLIVERFLALCRTTGLIRPTETIQFVDPPIDPQQALRSRAVTAITGIIGGLVFGIALAILAELLESRIFSADGIEAIARAPVIACLQEGPRTTSAPASAVQAAPVRSIRTSPVMRSSAALVVLIAGAALMWSNRDGVLERWSNAQTAVSELRLQDYWERAQSLWSK